MLRAAALCLAAIGVAGAACGGASSPKTAAVNKAATATPRPTPTPIPSRYELLPNGGLGVIGVAYNRIVDEHITPVDEAALLAAAWRGVQSVAGMSDLPVPPAPAFTGDRATDVGLFADAWMGLPANLREFPPTRWTAISAMAESLNDCHTYFLGPSLNPGGPSDQDRSLSGYGMTLTGRPALVAEVEKEPWSPAAAAGLQPGDMLVSIGGQDIAGKGPLEVLRLLADGDEGSNVEIRVQRPDRPDSVALRLNRSTYEPVNIQTRVLDGSIGYVRIHDWMDPRLTQRLREALLRFDKKKVTKWLIDLRGNPGGLVTADPISLFLYDGVAVRGRRRDGVIEEDQAARDTLPAKPLDVLVDGGTASMSEIFALSLQEHQLARLIGTKTDGCIGETLVDDIGDGSGLAVTFETVLGPVTGAELNGVGVTPDQVVERTAADIVTGRDPQLDAAVADLKGR
jgi:carboxyl-terminal processing protease